MKKEINDAYINDAVFKGISSKIIDFTILLENSKDISKSVRQNMTEQIQKLDKQAVSTWNARKALREIERTRAQRGDTQKAYEKAWVTLMEIEKTGLVPETIMGVFKQELVGYLSGIKQEGL